MGLPDAAPLPRGDGVQARPDSPQVLKFAAGVSEPLTQEPDAPAAQRVAGQNQLGQVGLGAQSGGELFAVGLGQQVLLSSARRDTRQSRVVPDAAQQLRADCVTSGLRKHLSSFLLLQNGLHTPLRA